MMTNLKRRYEMTFRFFKRVNVNTGLFNGHFIDVKTFYVLRFKTIPCVTFIGDMDVTKVFAYMNENNKDVRVATYQHTYFDHADKNVYFNNTVIVLKNKRMIELADNFCQVLHAASDYNWARQLVNDLAQFRMEKNITPAFRHTHVVGFAKEAEMN
jgi:hypothetical protein